MVSLEPYIAMWLVGSKYIIKWLSSSHIGVHQEYLITRDGAYAK